MRSILAAALLLPIAVPAGAQSLSATATVPSGAALEPITPIANPGQLSLGGSSTTGPFPTVSAQTGGLVNAGQLSFGGGGGGGGGRIGSSAGLSAAEMTLDQDQWALLCKVDGERNLGQLARDCGFTTFEAGQVGYRVFAAVEEAFDRVI